MKRYTSNANHVFFGKSLIMNPKVNGSIKLLQISLLAFYRNTERDTRHLKQASNFHREHYPGNTALALKIPYQKLITEK